MLELLGRALAVEIGDPPPVARDPKDDKFLATARAAGAPYLVTEDNDLLVLGQYEGVQIVTMATFLGLLDGEPG